MKPGRIKILYLIFLFVLNTIFLFLIGYSIYILESQGKYMMGAILFPISALIFFFLYKRYKFMMNKNREETQKDIGELQNAIYKIKRYRLELKDSVVILSINVKKYIFSLYSILLLMTGGPLLSLLLYIFFKLEINKWLQELSAYQISLLLHAFFNMETYIAISPEEHYYWYLVILQTNVIYYFDPMCTAIHVFCIFAGVIIFIPKSQDIQTGTDMTWRKVKTLAISISIIYLVNLLRMLILIYFSYHGVPWNIFHTLVNYISGVFAAFFFIFLVQAWLPEMFLSLYYLYPKYKYRKRSNVSYK